METKKFVLLDIDYITKNHIAVIRLFGKLLGENDGGSIIALDRSFRPYIYVRPYDVDDCINELSELGLFKVEKVRKRDVGELKDFLKINLKHPQNIPKLREKIRNLPSVEEVREHDIPFSHRYLINKGLFPMNTVQVQGKVLNSTRSLNELCIFEMQCEPPYGIRFTRTQCA